MKSDIALWVYILLLVAGGLIGFLKAKSKLSLYMAVGFAAALSLCGAGLLPRQAADWLFGALIIVFTVRLARTRKFMPAGMMLLVTILTMALRHLL